MLGLVSIVSPRTLEPGILHPAGSALRWNLILFSHRSCKAREDSSWVSCLSDQCVSSLRHDMTATSVTTGLMGVCWGLAGGQHPFCGAHSWGLDKPQLQEFLSKTNLISSAARWWSAFPHPRVRRWDYCEWYRQLIDIDCWLLVWNICSFSIYWEQ